MLQEADARIIIDRLLREAGCDIEDKAQVSTEEPAAALILPRLRGRLLEKIEIPLPPLDEQRRVVAYLDGLQAKAVAIRAAQAETQKELDALMPSVLAKAFRGEL